LAFTTIPGASATDATSFIGTEGVDILNTFATLTGLVAAEAGDDVITLSNTVGLAEWTVRGSFGNDIININSDLIGGLVNGNAGADTLNLEGVFGGARVLGGQDVDTINVNGAISGASVNGNKGNDKINVNASISGGTVYGGQGEDIIKVTVGATDSLVNGMIDGNIGDSQIFVTAAAAATTISNFEVVGGDTVDVINAGLVVGTIGADGMNATAQEGFTIKGNGGADQLTGTGRDDTIEGGEGIDTITGGYGADKMTGGEGVDTFVVATAAGGGFETWVGNLQGAAPNPAVVLATDEITDWGGVSLNGTINDQINVGYAVAAAGNILTGANAYADISAAVNANLAIGAGNVMKVAVEGAAGRFTSYLLISDGAAAATTGAVQLGSTGAYATEAAATDNIVAVGSFVV
jgi:Ca2+-binding RTX toxin-like protein